MSILSLIEGNQLLSTAIGLSSAGIVTFWLKDVPKALYRFIKRKTCTKLIVTNQNMSFYNIMEWFENKFADKNFHVLKITNGKWGHKTECVTSIGYGIHFIKYNKINMIVELIKDWDSNSERDKEVLMITKFGRNRKIFDEFIKETQDKNKFIDKTRIYKFDDYWWLCKESHKRNIDTVFIEQEKKNLLINTLNNFINNEEWYVKNGIPYQLGIMLYGSPGTGKTSLIKAIASHLNYPIFYLSPSSLNKIELALSTIDKNSIVVIEDIDSNSATHDREKKKEEDKTEEEKKKKDEKKVNLSEILNSLDGILATHGRILIATTNHIDDLDKALIRPGRIDLKLEINYVNLEILKAFINNFYPDNTLKNNFKIKSEITVAMLQQKVLEGKSFEEFIKEIEMQ